MARLLCLFGEGSYSAGVVDYEEIAIIDEITTNGQLNQPNRDNSINQTGTTTHNIHSVLYHFERHTHNLPIKLTHQTNSIHSIDSRNTPLQFRILHGDSTARIHHISLLDKMILDFFWNDGELGVVQLEKPYLDGGHITVDILLPRIRIVHTNGTEQFHSRIAVALEITITLLFRLGFLPNDSVLHSNLVCTDYDAIGKGMMGQYRLRYTRSTQRHLHLCLRQFHRQDSGILIANRLLVDSRLVLRVRNVEIVQHLFLATKERTTCRRNCDTDPRTR